MHGDGFVEKIDIKSSYLPDIQLNHFENYLKRIGKVKIYLVNIKLK